MQINKIITPVDFSECSELALITAAKLAKKHDCELVVAHMLELSESTLSLSETESNEQMFFMFALANKKIKEFLDKDYLQDVKVKPVIARHKVFTELGKIAKEEEADLIVVGSKGHSNHDGVFTGSNTQKIVRYSELPVLVVKSEGASLEDVLLITDFSKESAKAFNTAVTFLKSLGSKITFLHINLPNAGFSSTTEINAKVNSFIELLDDKTIVNEVKFISDYSVEGGVINYTETNKFDALATITHGRKGLSHFLIGSISEDFVNHLDKPIITFKI